MNKIIEEGGAAVNGRPILQSEVKDIVTLVNSILDNIGLIYKEDYENSGSAGKKKPEDTSGDIDFIVNKNKLIEIFNLGNEATRDEILFSLEDAIKEQGIEKTFVSKGLNLVSFGLPFNGDDDIVQVDLMIASNMEFARFFQTSPDYTKDESKYKSMVRNIFLMTISSTIFRRITKQVTLANGFVGAGEVEQYSVRLNDGVYKTRKNWIGKRNKLIKTKSTLKEYDELVNDTPQKFIDLLFNDVIPEELISFESVYDIFMSDRFKYPEHREKILISSVMAFDNNGVNIPEEIDVMYVHKAQDLVAKLDAEFINNKNSEIVNIETFEGINIKSFEKFINEEIKTSIKVTFKEVYMEKEVTRECVNMSKEQVIAIYGLNEPDIEWYQFEGEERIENH